MKFAEQVFVLPFQWSVSSNVTMTYQNGRDLPKRIIFTENCFGVQGPHCQLYSIQNIVVGSQNGINLSGKCSSAIYIVLFAPYLPPSNAGKVGVNQMYHTHHLSHETSIINITYGTIHSGLVCTGGCLIWWKHLQIQYLSTLCSVVCQSECTATDSTLVLTGIAVLTLDWLSEVHQPQLSKGCIHGITSCQKLTVLRLRHVLCIPDNYPWSMPFL